MTIYYKEKSLNVSMHVYIILKSIKQASILPVI
jgi:hypothetical protein